MIFRTMGKKSDPAILFFHAMGVTGDSSMPVAEHLKGRYFCILPTSSVYCTGQTYSSKKDELRQLLDFLQAQEIKRLELVVASSLGADLALTFLTRSGLPVEHVFFDGGQFARISRPLRTIMSPFLYLAIRSLYWSRGRTLKRILWCDDASIRPYFIAAGRALTWRDQRRQMADSLEDKPFPSLPVELQRRSFWAFGSAEDHFKYRSGVMEAYPQGNFPVFRDFDHMQYQIRDPEGFARMLECVMAQNALPPLPFLADS